LSFDTLPVFTKDEQGINTLLIPDLIRRYAVTVMPPDFNDMLTDCLRLMRYILQKITSLLFTAIVKANSVYSSSSSSMATNTQGSFASNSAGIKH